MQAEEIVFDVTSESHNLEFNKSGGYHASPKHNRKDFYFIAVIFSAQKQLPVLMHFSDNVFIFKENIWETL